MFFQKPPVNFAALGTDMHAHLLPGIDDGPKTMAESLQLIRNLANLGYTKLIATPHVYKAYYPNTTATILETLNAVRQAMQEDDLHIPLEAAAEYFLDEHFETLLETGDLLPLPGRFLLFEMSFFAPYPGVDDVVYKLRLNDYKPVLAHPERYNYYLGRGFDALETLWQHGCRLQLNLLSLDGAYGPVVKKQAFKLLDAGMVDFLGTDAHHMKHVEALRKMRVKGLEKVEFLNKSL
jgi:tyrosine-protein phosphatase YwqE